MPKTLDFPEHCYQKREMDSLYEVYKVDNKAKIIMYVEFFSNHQHFGHAGREKFLHVVDDVSAYIVLGDSSVALLHN